MITLAMLLHVHVAMAGSLADPCAPRGAQNADTRADTCSTWHRVLSTVLSSKFSRRVRYLGPRAVRDLCHGRINGCGPQRGSAHRAVAAAAQRALGSARPPSCANAADSVLPMPQLHQSDSDSLLSEWHCLWQQQLLPLSLSLMLLLLLLVLMLLVYQHK